MRQVPNNQRKNSMRSAKKTLAIVMLALTAASMSSIINVRQAHASAMSVPTGFNVQTFLSGPPFVTIAGLAFSQDGKLYISDLGQPPMSGGQRIFTINLATKSVSTLISGLPLGSPARMLVGDGRPLVGNDLIVSDWNSQVSSPCCDGRVFKISRQTGSFTVLASANPAFPPPGDPFGLALGPGGNFGDGLYVMDFDGASPNPPVLYRVNADGSETVVLVSPSTWTVDRLPTHIAFGTGGGFGHDLYVTDIFNPATIWRVKAITSDVSSFVLSSFVTGAPLIGPSSLRFGPGGAFGTNLYVLDASGVIFTIASDGTVSTFATGLPTANTFYPDLAFAPDGQSLFVAINDNIIEITPSTALSVSKFFTDSSLNPLPTDSNGNPKADVVLANGVVTSTNPGQVLAWVNVTNTAGAPLQSLKVNETLPLDWRVDPPWMPAQGAIHVFFANTTSLATNLEITQSSTIKVATGNPLTVHLAIPSFNATGIGHPLMPGQSILLSVKLTYALIGTSQSATSYPRNYTDTAVAAAWTQASFSGAQSTGSGSAFFTADAKVVS